MEHLAKLKWAGGPFQWNFQWKFQTESGTADALLARPNSAVTAGPRHID